MLPPASTNHRHDMRTLSAISAFPDETEQD
jgi:hypothetical protein